MFFAKALPRRRNLFPTIEGTFRKVDLLMTTLADVFLVEFVRKDLGLPLTIRTFADEGFQISMLTEARAMFRCTRRIHKIPPFIDIFSGHPIWLRNLVHW